MTPAWATRQPARDESGDTLIELLVALLIISTSFVVIVGGVGTAILGASLEQNRTTTDSLIRSAAETLSASSDSYTPCAAPADYQHLVPASPPGFSVTVTDVQYWDSTTNTFSRSCPAPDSGLQMVSLSAMATSGDVHAPAAITLQVVLRQP